MRGVRIPPTAVALAALALSVAAAVPAARSETVLMPGARARAAGPGQQTLVIGAGLGRVIQMSGGAASVFVADPKVAEVKPASATSLFVFGVAPGRTTIAALDAAGAPVAQYDVTVEPSSYTAAAAKGSIGRAIPGNNIRVETFANGLSVTGDVNTPAEAQRAMDIVRGSLPTGQTATNHLNVASSTQVNLRVTIVEMSRDLTRQIGVNWTAVQNLGTSAAIGLATSNPLAAAASITPSTLQGVYSSPGKYGTNINAVVQALAQDSLVHVLAEPNLTAVSGEQASFLVGGEFPIPVSNTNNTITVTYKQYGVSLAFVPTVFSDGHISLKVKPEVSSLTNQGAVSISGTNTSIQLPGLSVRRAETTVELGSGESFAIAGLLQDQSTLTANALPFLGEIPILGALFRSDSFHRNETELVIIVTPYVVRPVSDPAKIARPDDDWQPPSDFERILLLRQRARTSRAVGPAAAIAARSAPIPGQAGFVLQ